MKPEEKARQIAEQLTDDAVIQQYIVTGYIHGVIDTMKKDMANSYNPISSLAQQIQSVEKGTIQR